MIVVSDTSTITNLYQIGQLELLRMLYGQVVIPPGVRRELARLPEQYDYLKQQVWIETIAPQNDELVNELLQLLDLGEAEAITLAVERKAKLLLIDEYAGRQLAKKHGLAITGLLGVLIAAKRTGLVAEIAPMMSQLRTVGFRINQKLVDKVLNALGE